MRTKRYAKKTRAEKKVTRQNIRIAELTVLQSMLRITLLDK